MRSELSPEVNRMYDQRYYYKHLLKVRKKNRDWEKKWRADNPKLSKKKNKKQNETYTQSRSANSKVFQAIKMGKLIKPKHCSCCGVIETIYAHHEDYKKPLKVEWLCMDCHMNKHYKNWSRIDEMIEKLK